MVVLEDGTDDAAEEAEEAGNEESDGAAEADEKSTKHGESFQVRGSDIVLSGVPETQNSVYESVRSA